MPTRTASAVWNGGLQDGNGRYKIGNGRIEGSYTFGSRFAEASGSNPEELLAAASAACYSMALSGGLEKNGTRPNNISTTAECTVEKVGDGFEITTMKLTVQASVPGVDNPKFQEIAKATLTGCPVSKAFLGNLKLELDARLS